MTTTAIPSEPAPPSNGTDPADETQPLSAFVQGTLRLHFAHGAEVTRQVSQEDARSVLAMQKEDRTNDQIDWHSQHWFTWQPDQIVYTSFDTNRDQNWKIAPADRQRLIDAGHPGGVIASLVAYWSSQERRSEPCYSVRAVVALYTFARDGADRETWQAAARALEGRRGAAKLARAFKDADSPVVPDDHAEPEDEPTSAAASAPEGSVAAEDEREANAAEDETDRVPAAPDTPEESER